MLKVYNSESIKYRGEEYNILDQKLQVLYNYYKKIRISQDYYYIVFSTILKGRASNFYYDKLSSREYNFNTLVSITRAYFKIEENK